MNSKFHKLIFLTAAAFLLALGCAGLYSLFPDLSPDSPGLAGTPSFGQPACLQPILRAGVPVGGISRNDSSQKMPGISFLPPRGNPDPDIPERDLSSETNPEPRNDPDPFFLYSLTGYDLNPEECIPELFRRIP